MDDMLRAESRGTAAVRQRERSEKSRERRSISEAAVGAGLNRSVARGLGVLLEVVRSEKPPSFVDLQKRLKLPKATLHKLLYTLEALNFLKRNEESGRYSIGLSVLELNAGGAARPGDLRSVLDPIFHRLVEEWNETLHLCVYDKGEEIILDRLDPPFQMVRLATAIGRRHPAYATSGGLAALALLPEEAALKDLPSKMPTMTKNTVKTRKQLRERLREVRERGYGIDMEEAYIGVRCVGIAVSVPGWPIVTVSFSLPVQRAAVERMHELGETLLRTAPEIEAALVNARQS